MNIDGYISTKYNECYKMYDDNMNNMEKFYNIISENIEIIDNEDNVKYQLLFNDPIKKDMAYSFKITNINSYDIVKIIITSFNTSINNDDQYVAFASFLTLASCLLSGFIKKYKKIHTDIIKAIYNTYNDGATFDEILDYFNKNSIEYSDNEIRNSLNDLIDNHTVVKVIYTNSNDKYIINELMTVRFEKDIDN